MRKWFYVVSVLSILGVLFLSYFCAYFLLAYIVVGPIVLLGFYDVFQRKHTLLRNFPVIAHFRYRFEDIRVELQQYLIEQDWEGRPLNRMQRSLVYARSKGRQDTVPFGTREDVLAIGYEWLNHSLNIKKVNSESPSVLIGNKQCEKPYNASLFNISAMSFGSLSKNAILALNKGAKLGGFYHNTGEGGLSSFHLKHGGDVVWQIGTGYFGCRTQNGEFCPDKFKENAIRPSVKMIEIKLSQGAKPSHGGILPASKLTPELAKIREVQLGEDIISPPVHSAFSTPVGLMEFIAQLKELSGGKPVGFKFCLGKRREFLSICKAMLKTQIYPDFITIDGSDGGTGAAPLVFSSNVGTPLQDALPFVHNALVGTNLREHIKLIVSGKVVNEFDIISKLAMGADLCNSARAMMLALGCIQSLTCNTNKCPTGVATQDKSRCRGLVVSDKAIRVRNYHQKTIDGLKELLSASGASSISDIDPSYLMRRVSATQVKRFDEIYEHVEQGSFLKKVVPASFAHDWRDADPNVF